MRKDSENERLYPKHKVYARGEAETERGSQAVLYRRNRGDETSDPDGAETEINKSEYVLLELWQRVPVSQRWRSNARRARMQQLRPTYGLGLEVI